MYWKQWLKTLLSLTVLLSLLELLLPSGGLAKFSRLVLGLTLMLAVLQPISLLLSGVLEAPDLLWLESSLPEPERALEAKAERVQLAAAKPFLAQENQGLTKQIEGLLLTIDAIEEVQVELISSKRGDGKLLIELEPFDEEIRDRVVKIVTGVLNLTQNQITVRGRE